MNHNTQEAPRILLAGGAGKTGRRVAERLSERGVPFRLGSRSTTPPLDWQDETSWAPALAGVESVYVAYSPDLAAPGAGDDIRLFTRAAVGAEVQRMVLLSGRGEEEAQRAERIVQEAAIEWTIVRCSWFNQNFNQNFSEHFLVETVLDGEVALPAGAVPEPFVDADDVADVVAAALTEDGHAGEVYDMTGPRLLTFADAIAEIARATGRDIRFVPVTVEDYALALTEAGLPDDLVSLLRYLFGEGLDGRNAYLGDGVQRALGREPRDFADYARDAAATGVWSVPAGAEVPR